MTHRVLFVCAMNVCRSPIMAFSFTAAIDDAGRADWAVTSGGTSVLRSAPMCDVGAALIGRSAAGAAFAASHVSSPLLKAEAASQDLIVVASRAERGEVAQLDPAFRARTFTLREAIALGGPSITAAELEPLVGRRSGDEDKPLAGYAELLHRRRGTLPTPANPVGGAQHPFDIPDVHFERRRRHTAALRQVQDDVLLFHRQLTAYLGSRRRVV
jgi:protein-tyrosine phosphatase